MNARVLPICVQPQIMKAVPLAARTRAALARLSGGPGLRTGRLLGVSLRIAAACSGVIVLSGEPPWSSKIGVSTPRGV